MLIPLFVNKEGCLMKEENSLTINFLVIKTYRRIGKNPLFVKIISLCFSYKNIN